MSKEFRHIPGKSHHVNKKHKQKYKSKGFDISNRLRSIKLYLGKAFFKLLIIYMPDNGFTINRNLMRNYARPVQYIFFVLKLEYQSNVYTVNIWSGYKTNFRSIN